MDMRYQAGVRRCVLARTEYDDGLSGIQGETAP